MVIGKFTDVFREIFLVRWEEAEGGITLEDTEEFVMGKENFN